MAIVTDFLAIIGALITGMIGWITSGITAVVGIFWDATAGEFTFIGILALFGIGIGVVSLIIAFVRGFVQK